MSRSKAIAEELGEGDDPVEEAEDYRRRVRALSLPEESEKKLLEECDRLSKMPFASQEGAVLRGYLDTCLVAAVECHDHATSTILRRRAAMLDREH